MLQVLNSIELNTIDSLNSLCSYVQYLTSNVSSEGIANFRDEKLLNRHFGKSILLFDKYLLCSIPDPQLEFIFENQNIENYSAELDLDNKFKCSICDNEGAISEIVSPFIHAEHFNPYKRWLSSVSSGCRACSSILDIAGLELVDLDIQHDNVFLDLVCTFPGEVDYFLINPDYRDILIERLDKCRKKFFFGLHELWHIPDHKTLGCSSNIHFWPSSIPVLTHAHVHNFIPFFVVDKKPMSPSLELQEYFLDLMQDCISSETYNKSFSKEFETAPGAKRDRSKVSIKFREQEFCVKAVTDVDLFKQFRQSMSSAYAEAVGFQQLDWFNPKFPIDVEAVKELWSDIVYEEFGPDIMDHWVKLDIYVEFVPWHQKEKILHKLQYKCRPPVLDLDLFFKECEGFVPYYDHVDPENVYDFLNYKLEIAVKCSNYSDICKYENLLKKAETVFNNYSNEDILNWLEFLSTYRTDTRVYGFWKNLRRYRLDPDNSIFPRISVCPVCGGSIAAMGPIAHFDVSSVVVRSRSKFLVFDVKGPPAYSVE